MAGRTVRRLVAASAGWEEMGGSLMESAGPLAQRTFALDDCCDLVPSLDGSSRRHEIERGDKLGEKPASGGPQVIASEPTSLDPLIFGGAVHRANFGASRIVGGISKRAMDLTIAFAAFVLLSPLFVLIALLIRATSGHSIFFAHKRVGQNGRMFYCYKFCTMVPNADEILRRHLAENAAALQEWELTRKLANDPRTTRFGQLLRKSSLDELPQLINVIRGEMSCVGPRPVVADELSQYGASKSEYLKAKPGMTGLWQISGRSTLLYEERIALDCHYIRNWSLWTDVIILWKTIPAVFRFEEAV
jgi:exopolysaccharide production protein ExoY